LNDDGLRCRLAHAGSRQVRQFTWEPAVARLEEILSKGS
jgi:hypothetical protein